MKERRQSERIEYELIANFTVNDEKYSSKLINLSLGGMEISLPSGCQLKNDDACRISLVNMDIYGDFHIDMLVCWVTEDHIGLKYDHINSLQKVRLNKTLSEISKKNVLEKNHFVMWKTDEIISRVVIN